MRNVSVDDNELTLQFRRGYDLIQMCHAFKHADTEIDQRVAVIENSVFRTNEQLRVIRKMDRELDESFKAMQKRLIDIFIAKLQNVLDRLSRVAERRTDDAGGEQYKIKRSKYAIVKKHLDSAIDDLERWQGRFDPTWKLVILRSGGQTVDVVLSESHQEQSKPTALPKLKDMGFLRRIIQGGKSSGVSVYLPANQLTGMQSQQIPYSTATVYCQDSPRRFYVVDTVDVGQPYISKSMEKAVTKSVRDLAEKLYFVDPAESTRLGLLQCRGFVKQDESGFRFVFRQPQDSDASWPPRSLRSMLFAASEHSLSERLNLAKQLARAVSYVHTLGFVHKNIRPETIIGFWINGRSVDLECAFLTGFGQLRAESGPTSLIGDAEWEKNLYRHPDRQGVHPEEEYVMQHDIYSLGVCLLEIGLWRSFVSYDTSKSPPRIGLLGSLANPRSPSESKAALVQMAKKQLPSKVGNKYCDIVVNCLTCFDGDNIDFADELQSPDKTGIQIGVRYIEKVGFCSSLSVQDAKRVPDHAGLGRLGDIVLAYDLVAFAW